jgi:hypothetical protein
LLVVRYVAHEVCAWPRNRAGRGHASVDAIGTGGPHGGRAGVVAAAAGAPAPATNVTVNGAIRLSAASHANHALRSTGTSQIEPSAAGGTG